MAPALVQQREQNPSLAAQHPVQGRTAPACQQLERGGNEGVVRGAVQLEVEQPALQHRVVRPGHQNVDLEVGVVLLVTNKETWPRVSEDLIQLLPDEFGSLALGRSILLISCSVLLASSPAALVVALVRVFGLLGGWK